MRIKSFIKAIFLATPMFLMYARQGTCQDMADADPDNCLKAVCVLNSEPGQTAKGVVVFKQLDVNSDTVITGNFEGLKPNNKHGFHIHQFGNLTNGCVSAGPHYNPFNMTHGGPDSETRHIGDLGNVSADSKGNSVYNLTDSMIDLSGPYSIIGRSCVLHAGTDDLGQGGNDESLKTGNSGGRIACGVIGNAH